MYYLSDRGVQTQVHYIPIYLHPYYQSVLDEMPSCPNAETYYGECLSLPLFVGMDDTDPKKVVQLLVSGISELIKVAEK